MITTNTYFSSSLFSFSTTLQTPYLRASAVLKGADDTTDFKTKSTTTTKKDKDDDSNTRRAPKKKETCEDLSKDECEDDKKCEMKGKKCVKMDSLDFDFEQKKSKCEGLSKDDCKKERRCEMDDKGKKAKCVEKESLVLKGAVYTTDFKAKESTTKKDKEEDDDSKRAAAPKKKTVKECEDLKDKACKKSSECELKDGKCVAKNSLDFEFEEGASESTSSSDKSSSDSSSDEIKRTSSNKCYKLKEKECKEASKCVFEGDECVAKTFTAVA